MYQSDIIKDNYICDVEQRFGKRIIPAEALIILDKFGVETTANLNIMNQEYHIQITFIHLITGERWGMSFPVNRFAIMDYEDYTAKFIEQMQDTINFEPDEQSPETFIEFMTKHRVTIRMWHDDHFDGICAEMYMPNGRQVRHIVSNDEIKLEGRKPKQIEQRFCSIFDGYIREVKHVENN